MSKPKVLVADPIAQRGIDELADGGLLDVTVKIGLKQDELLEIIGEFHGARRPQRDEGEREGHRSRARI